MAADFPEEAADWAELFLAEEVVVAFLAGAATALGPRREREGVFGGEACPAEGVGDCAAGITVTGSTGCSDSRGGSPVKGESGSLAGGKEKSE